MRIEGVERAREARAAGRPALVSARFVGDTITLIGAAERLMQEGRGDFLLESVEGGVTRGRYSLLGIDPDCIFRADENGAARNHHWRTDRDAFAPCGGNPVDALRTLAEASRIAPDDMAGNLPPALALLVGYFSYETVGMFEPVPRAPANPLTLPDMLFVRPGVVLVFDRLNDDVHIAAPVWPDMPGDDAVEAACDRLHAVAAALLSRSTQPQAERIDGAASGSEEGSVSAPTPHVRPEAYRDMVLRAQDYIAAGDIFQVVLAQRFSVPFTLPPLALYRALRRVNPSPYLYLLDLPSFAVVGSSPEILVRVRDGEVTVRPIAGTRPRGRTEAEDRENEAQLLADPKERAEHLMLLDLGRNDVGRVAEGGTVTVTDSFFVERYSHVMHMVSNVTGRLDPRQDALAALLAGFPAGTVSGAPKVRACQIIAELESETRGPYAGGVGYFAPDGSIDSCIVLRTAILKDGVMHVQAGAGIVADSDPHFEQRECEAKASALFAAAREAVCVAREVQYGQ